jgi:hypothetical protein
MASAAATIADSLKTDIDAQSWPVTLSTYREYMTSINRATLGSEIRVSIFPYTHQVERIARSTTTKTHGVGVVIRAAVDPDDKDALDDLIETIESLSERYAIEPIGGGSPNLVQMLLADQLYDVDQLADSRLFVGGITINYQTR